MNKQVFIKIYDQSDTYLGTFFDFAFASFSMNINGGLGELNFEVPRKFDDFGEGTEIDFNNKIKVFVSDNDTPSGTQIYEGYIVEYSSSVSNEESVSVRVLGYLSKLQLDILKSGTTLQIAYTSKDPSFIFKDIIDKYKAVNTSSPISYTSSTIPNTGNSVNIDFSSSTYLNAIQELKAIAPVNWYFYLDSDNLFYFDEVSNTPDYMFVFERDISTISFNKSIAQMRNGLIFWNGLPTSDPDYFNKFYSNSASISGYGRQIDIKKDSRYKAGVGTMNIYGQKFIDTYSSPINEVNIRVIDNSLSDSQVDIELIKPGQTCKVLNIANNNALSDNMIITSVTYAFDYVDLTISDKKAYITRSIVDLTQKALENSYGQDAPSNYT